jgi:energy-coupling factor transporter ATP-binding protein EcfA2
MKLKQFRIHNFRSVDNSDWIEAENITALIGVNESGKTNLLLPLWKLNPARDGQIQPTSDYPKTLFGSIRSAPGEYKFIEADFLTGPLARKLAERAGISDECTQVVRVTRFFDGHYYVEFPDYEAVTSVETSAIRDAMKDYSERIRLAHALKQEAELQSCLVLKLASISDALPIEEAISLRDLQKLKQTIDHLAPNEPAKTSVIVPLISQLSDLIAKSIAALERPLPGEVDEIHDLVKRSLPTFVYYSNYGNLDSEIYLPHVVENLKRSDLGSKEAAKARTLKVLFNFVKLQPEEILELGRDFRELNGQDREPSPEEISAIAEKKRTRSILLQSAGSLLTQKFRNWWKQGDYRFRFEADGNHFRIWVADDRRPTEVELENRSTGLQWFLSFYLVFLVESQGQHKNSVLLLDEPGVSLHPLAQRDLSSFFENLAASSQIIYTSHSPFLVDADRLERARKVFVAKDGTTKATANLRHSEGNDEQRGAAYAVHSALNLSVAESLLLGCLPILVEGASDQHYLATIKSLLVSQGKIKPSRELVFPPCGGAKTAGIVASILTGRDEILPKVLLDDDVPGRRLGESLKGSLYSGAPEKILSVSTFVGFEHAEVEDLFPPELLAEDMDRMERGTEERLSDVIQGGMPFVGQVEKWAERNRISLQKHWKVELASRYKRRILSRGIKDFSQDTLERWTSLFECFE